jgi:hypothetical protein
VTRRSAIGLAQLPLVAMMGVAEYLWYRGHDSPAGRLDHVTALLALLTATVAVVLVCVPFSRSVKRPWLAVALMVPFGAGTGLGTYALYHHDRVDRVHVYFLLVVWAAFFGIMILVDHLAERSQRSGRKR